MIKKTSEKIKIGVFVIAGAALFTLGVYMIGNKQTLFGSSFDLIAVFRNVKGLQTGNNVRYSGINVGTVGDITMINDTSIQVLMRIQTDIQQHIKKDAIATISTDGLVGSMFVNIIPGDGVTGQVKSGDIIQSYSRIGAEDMLSTLNVTNENAALLTADLLKITESINQGKGTLGMLLKDSMIAADLKTTIANLKTTSRQTIAVMQKLNNTVDLYSQENSIAGVLFRDSLQAEELRNVIENLALASENVLETIDGLNVLMDDVKQGQGVISTMMYDTALVIDLKESMSNINTSTVLLNENLEAMKHSFPVKGYFKKEAKRQAKEEKKDNEQ